MREFVPNKPVQFFTDRQTDVDKLGAVLFPTPAAKAPADIRQPFHPRGIMVHEGLQGNVIECDHVPEGVVKIVRAPPEFIGIVEAVRDEGSLRRRGVDGLLKRFVVPYGQADGLDIARGQSEAGENFPGKLRSADGMVLFFTSDIVEQSRALGQRHQAVHFFPGNTGLFTFDDHQGAGVEGDFHRVLHAVAEVVFDRFRGKNPDRPDQGGPFEAISGNFARMGMIDVKRGKGVLGKQQAGLGPYLAISGFHGRQPIG
jgi:hypothetical protein